MSAHYYTARRIFNSLLVVWKCVQSRSFIFVTLPPIASIGNCRNVRGLGKSMVVFRLFEKLIHSNERSTKFESLYQE